ncbi:MAG: hypothetical protein Roseis2KO_27100 [Roseivirga sp.]
MRYLSIIIGLLAFNLLSAQSTLELSIDNPEPRIGDKVELSFSFSFFIDEIRTQLSDDMVMTNAANIFGTGSDKFTRVLEFKRTGKHTVGPFKFDFNGKTIITDSINIDVAEELPFEEGLWIRLTSDQSGNKFLIVEQLVGNQSDYTEKENGFAYTVGGKLDEGTEFAEIEDLYEDGVTISFKQSRSNTRTSDQGDVFAAGLSYSFKKYKVEFDEGFNGVFTLKKKHLKNLPKKTSFKKLEINP